MSRAAQKDPVPAAVALFDWRYNLRVNIIGRPSVVMRASRRREGPMGATRCDSFALAAGGRQRFRLAAAALAALCFLAGASDSAKADAGGLSFWLPGIFGSLAAAPGVPGWAYSSIYLHVQTSAQGGKEFI